MATDGIKVTICDGRAGRDPDRVTGDQGEVLAKFVRDAPLSMGDALTLPDGTEVSVVGLSERITGTEWHQIVHVGNRWASVRGRIAHQHHRRSANFPGGGQASRAGYMQNL